jgi:hypothetical protein
MGINRNQDRAEDEVTDFRDDRVCKFFLAGVCPHGKVPPYHIDLFVVISFFEHGLKRSSGPLTASLTRIPMIQICLLIRSVTKDLVKDITRKILRETLNRMGICTCMIISSKGSSRTVYLKWTAI